MNLPPGKPLFHGSYEYTAYTPDQVREIEQGIAKLKKQLKEAKKDSRMLDWLEKNREYSLSPPHPKPHITGEELWNLFHENEKLDSRGATLRLAIQNAMKEGK